MQNNSLVAFVLGAMVIWSGISWYWYVCGIKGLCGSQQTVAEEVVNDVADRQDNQVVGGSRTVTTQEVVQEETTIECSPYLQSFIRLGYDNNSSDVRRLEEYLNTYEGENLDVNGRYENIDEDAVKRFQLKYRSEVMDPWGMTTPSGFVFKTTRNHINALYCAYQYAEGNNN